MSRFVAAIALVCLAAVSSSCGSEPAAAATATAKRPKLATGTDAGALADLKTSAEWTKPRCRWLETGAWVLAWPQEVALYEAARNLGYIDLQQAGMANRIRPEPAWKVALTDAGTAASATCGSGSSRSEVWGLPVSERRFISGRRIQAPDMYNPDRTMFEVEYQWVPTSAGEMVKNVLTGKMAVEQGLRRAKVSLRYGDRAIGRGRNGWRVDQIGDLAAASR